MKVAVKDVKAGMVIARDLEYEGAVLLRQGSALTSAMIAVVTRRGILSVDVDVDDQTALELSAARAANINASQQGEEFNREREELQALFATANDDDQMDLLKYCMLQQLVEKYNE